MPKKRLLITAMSMVIGGAEKSLVNLLNLLDYGRFDVDVLLFQRKGEFLPQIPEQVNIISVPEVDALYGIAPEKRMNALKCMALHTMRYVGTGVTRLTEKQFDRRRLNRWKGFYSALIPPLPGRYDYAVSYSGGETYWYIAEKVNAPVKVVYYHNDYSNIDIDVPGELEYLKRADRIATISDACAESLRALFPSQERKIVIAQNPTCISLVKNLGQSSVEDGFSGIEGRLRVVSVGRVETSKGFDMAVRAAAKVKARVGAKFEWIVVGDGSQHSEVQRVVDEEGISDVFKLVGSKLNPYPYMASAQLIAQTSRFEGKSVVLDEARVFGLPVLATAYSSAQDQVRPGEDGIIVPMDVDGIAEGLIRLIESPEELEAYKKAASKIDVSRLEDISSFLALVDDNSYETEK